MAHRASARLAATMALAGGALCAGCSFFQSPYTDRPTFTSGEKGSVAFGSITNKDAGDCQDNGKEIPGCRFMGKVILTKPTDNVSFQIFQKNDTLVMCASPAEAAKSISTNSALTLALNAKVAGAPASQSASAAASATQAIVALHAADAPTHYVATATYANCLAFASGMITANQAAEAHMLILNRAIYVGNPASAPSK